MTANTSSLTGTIFAKAEKPPPPLLVIPTAPAVSQRRGINLVRS
jgi:hypothetical protein